MRSGKIRLDDKSRNAVVCFERELRTRHLRELKRPLEMSLEPADACRKIIRRESMIHVRRERHRSVLLRKAVEALNNEFHRRIEIVRRAQKHQRAFDQRPVILAVERLIVEIKVSSHSTSRTGHTSNV